MIVLNPYIGFRDNARQAMEFYKTVFGGDLALDTFKENHASDDPADADKIMHAQLKTPNGLMLMAADTPNSMEFKPGENISISLSGANEDDATLRGYWDKLSGDGGKVTMPLETAPWGDAFGMCTDKFGIHWMVNIASDKPAK